MVWEEVAAEENLNGLTEEQLATFRERAVPVPGGLLREATSSRTTPAATSRARSSRPATPPKAYQAYAKGNPDIAFLAGIPELRNITWIDLPTSHWPMWSRPDDLARIIGDVATKAGAR